MKTTKDQLSILITHLFSQLPSQKLMSGSLLITVIPSEQGYKSTAKITQSKIDLTQGMDAKSGTSGGQPDKKP